MKKNEYLRSKLFWVLAIICFLSLFLFLGQTYFNTRGEPREALVGMAMLQENNWTLPITNGVDIAYKPPLFHWAIASISSVVGEVTEYTSRMPSAIALTVMLLAGFVFFAKRRGAEVAFLASLITLTNFEVHRAGVNCRVDMLLAALMVLALYALYRWTEKGMKGVPWLGILCLSGAFLTKGPVGLVLPCGVVALFALIRGANFWRIFFSYLAIAIAACVLPALWYLAAWKQGGDSFMNLVYEENVLRFLGKMSYRSHENPWHYNVMTLVTGFVPYTLLLLISLFTLKRMKSAKEAAASRLQPSDAALNPNPSDTALNPKQSSFPGKIQHAWRGFCSYIKQMDDTRLFALLSFVVMFVFYCIPKSKRSVYLLPIYPFVAYFIAEYIFYLVKKSPKAVKIYNYILAGLCVLLTLVFCVVKAGLIPHTLFHGKHAAENIGFLQAIENLPLGINLVLILLPLAVGIIYYKMKKTEHVLAYAGGVFAFALFLTLDGIYLPAILNTKSNITIAERLVQTDPHAKVYSFVTDTSKGNRMHPFTINFYLKDTIVPFIDFEPEEGFLLLAESEFDIFQERYGSKYTLKEWPDSRYKSCDDRKMTRIYTFKKIQ